MAKRIGFLRALGYPFRGARFVYVAHPGLARLWLPPVLITAALLVLVGYHAFGLRQELTAGLWAAPVGPGFWPELGRWVHGALEWLVAVLVFAVGAVAVALVSGVVAAPFNDALSQEVERLQGGPSGPPLTAVGVLRDLGRTVFLESLKLGLYAAVMVPMFVASLVWPGVGQVLYSAFGFGFSAAFFCVDYMDWPAARRDWPVGRRLSQLARRPGTTLGFGLGVWVMLLIPLVNLLFMPAAVAGGTLLFLDLHAIQEK